MIKDALLGVGALSGLSLTAVGAFIYFGFRGDNTDADALARALLLSIGVPCLVVGPPLFGVCAWGLAR